MTSQTETGVSPTASVWRVFLFSILGDILAISDFSPNSVRIRKKKVKVVVIFDCIEGLRFDNIKCSTARRWCVR